MKPRSSFSTSIVTLAPLASLFLVMTASAEDRYWDSNGADGGMGGGGSWTSLDTSLLWRSGEGADLEGGTIGPWINQDTDPAATAILSGVDGTLTTSGTVTTNKIKVVSGIFTVAGSGFSYVGAGASVNVAADTALTHSASLLTSTVGLAVSGGGTLTFSANNRAYGSALAVTGSGTRVIFSATNGLANTGSNSHNFGPGTTLQVNNANNYYSTLILNAATVDSRNAGGLVLQNGSGITVPGSATSVILSNSASTGITINGAGLPFNVGNTGDPSGIDLDIPAKVSGGNNLTKTGAGTLRLSGANAFGTLSTAKTMSFGINNQSRGYLRLASSGALGSIDTLSLVGGGTAICGVQLEGGITITKALTTSGRSPATGTGHALRNLSGDNAWNGTFTISGTGGGYGIVSDAGTLTLGNTITSSLAVASGTRGVSFAGAGNFLVSGNIIRTSASTVDLSVSKEGAGTLTLAGTNTYGSGTTITGGTLALAATGSINNSIFVSTASGTTFDVTAYGSAGYSFGAAQNLRGTGTINGTVVTSGSVTPGFTTGTLSITGDLTLNAGAGIDADHDINGSSQLETATAAGTATGDGTVTVTVTGDGIAGSPLVIDVPILTGDAPADWAGKVRTALGAEAAITALYSVGGLDATVTLTRLSSEANDATLNIAFANGTTSPGITAAPTSANTRAGVVPGGMDLLAVAGKLDITGSTLNLLINGTPTAPAYVIATYGTRSGTFATVNNLPAGYEMDYNYNSGTAIAVRTIGAAGNFDSWALANGVTGGAGGDSDNDSISNLTEYALDLNFNGSDGSAGNFTGSLLSFSKRAVAVSNGDLTYAIETSPNLLPPWTVVTPDVNNATTISYTLPSGQGKLFSRLRVSQN